MGTTKTISNLYTIAFYNIENLFDVHDDDQTHDNDFLPFSKKRWTKKRYEKKIYKLSSVISKIGSDESDNLPAIVGLAEVENNGVLRDLTQSEHLKDHHYKYIHHDSLDERGVDVALLYNPDFFQVEDSKTYTVYLENDLGEQDFTRDILLVTGQLNNEKIYILVNHWSSRREGVKETEHKRILASNKVIEILAEIRKNDNDAKILVMGDFNDNPNNESIKNLKKEGLLHNPMETLKSYKKGSLIHHFVWYLFDQILITPNFFASTNAHIFHKAEIFNKKFLTQYEGKYKGQPFRTFIGSKYKGGYSDHFPVYIQLKKV